MLFGYLKSLRIPVLLL